MWSTGCVMAELMLGQPLFPGESGIDQLVEIIKVLGTPTREQIRTMNPNYMEHKFPQIKPHPFNKVRVVWRRQLDPVSSDWWLCLTRSVARSSAELRTRRSTSFPRCSNTRRRNDCRRSKPCVIRSSTS